VVRARRVTPRPARQRSGLPVRSGLPARLLTLRRCSLVMLQPASRPVHSDGRVTPRGVMAAMAAMALLALAGAGAAPPPPLPAGAGSGGKSGVAAPLPAPAPSPPAPAAADHRRENKLLVRRYLIEVLAGGKVDKLDEIVAKTFVDRTPGATSLRGPDAVRQAQRKLHSLFSKLEYDPQELIAEDDRVAARYLVLATPRLDEGAPAPQPLVLNGVALFRIRDGRIQELFVLNDQVGLLRQLGYTLVPPGAAPPPSGSPAPNPPGPKPPAPAPPASPTTPPSASPSPGH
jgi:predicted ester cyclase